MGYNASSIQSLKVRLDTSKLIPMPILMRLSAAKDAVYLLFLICCKAVEASLLILNSRK